MSSLSRALRIFLGMAHRSVREIGFFEWGALVGAYGNSVAGSGAVGGQWCCQGWGQVGRL